MKTISTPERTDDKDTSKEDFEDILEDLDKQDLEDMKKIFTQDDNEVLDIPSMINKVHVENHKDLEDVLADQDRKENGEELPNFINEDITLEEPLTYSRKD